MGDDERRSRQELPAGKQVNRFQIERRIGQGGYGDIYSVTDPGAGARYALKIEFLDAEKQGLSEEVHVLQTLHDSAYFPSLIAHGVFEDFRFLAMTLFGPSLSNMRRALPDQKYSAYSVFRLAIEMLNCIEAFHAHGYIHRDIKPGNFLVNPSNARPVCLIDFGLSESFIDPATGRHIPDADDVGFTGTCRYASLHAHDERQLSRRDDLISWFYAVIELAEGRLPWPGSKNRELTRKNKQRISVSTLCSSLPAQFPAIWRRIKALKFKEQPNYQEIKAMISASIRGIAGDLRSFDWERMDRAIIAQISPIPLDMRDDGGDVEDKVEEGGCCSVA